MPKLTERDYVYIPTQLLDGAAESLAYGNTKYGAGEPREDKSAHDRYNSLVGHLQDWRRGEVVDPESGLCHLKHAAAQLAFLMRANESVEMEVGASRRPGYRELIGIYLAE